MDSTFDVVIGVVTSVIGGVLVGVMRPRGVSFYYFDGNVVLWCVACVLSVVLGIVVAFLVFNTVSPDVFSGILFGTLDRTGGLPTILAMIVAICMGVVATIGGYRALITQMRLY